MPAAHKNNTGHADSATDELKETAAEIGRDVLNLGGQISDAAREQYESVKHRASKYVDGGRKKAREWEEGFEEYVQEKPIKSLLIAAGIGMLLGMYWRRRR